MHHFKGAIFDMDGTLLDSMPVWDRLSERYLNRFGIRVVERDYAAIEGMTQMQAAQYFIDAYPALPMDAQTLAQGLDELIDARYEALARPRDGVLHLLDALRERGIGMAVATLTARRHAEKALRAHAMLDYFRFLLTIEDVGVSKRQPDIYLHAAGRLGLTPTECIVFEDAPYACTTAQRAGFTVCGMAEPAYAAGVCETRRASTFFVEHSFDELWGKML